jgi:tetratricopeptide (TPR) repeat protein
MLVDRGFLYRDDGGWKLREGELPLPESVQGIIASRLDGLRPQEKDVLSDAAVIGRRFWPGAVAAVAGQAREEVEPVLRSLDQKELVRRLSSSSVAGELQYSFRHALVRDVAYGQIPRAERGRRHLLAAGWIESLGRPEDHSETIAHHYLRALEYQDADAFADRAQRALREAGDRAFALNAHGAACRYYEAAVELTAADAEDRPQLLLRYGTALFRARNAGDDVLTEAYEALRSEKQFDLAAEASIGLAELLLTAGERDRAFERLDEATALVREAPASPVKANVLANVSRLLMIADDYERTIDVGRQALALAELLELDEIRAHALNNIGVARFALGDADGVSDLERSLELALSINSPESVRAYLNLGTIAANEGDLRRAFALYDEGRRAARRFGDERGLRWLDAERLYEFYWTSRWDKALALAEQLLSADDGPATSEFDARLVRAWIRLARGDESGALEDVDAAAEFGRRAREAQFLLPALAARARVLAHAGQLEAASELLAEILRVWRAEAPSYASFWLSDVAAVAADVGADSFLAECATREVSTRWLDAAVAFASGHYDESARLYRAIGSAPDEAHARATAAPNEVSEQEQI